MKWIYVLLWLFGLTPCVLGGNGTDAVSSAAYFNVLDLGAVGDGVTDDTTGFTAGIAAVNAAGGGTLYIPEGTYNVNSVTLAALPNSSMTITADNVTIRGEGFGTRIELTGEGAARFIFAQCVDNLRVQDLAIVGNGISSRGCIWYDNTGASDDHRGFWLDRCYIENFRAGGWVTVRLMRGSLNIDDVRIRDCTFISREGNLYGDGSTGTASGCIRLNDTGNSDAGHIENFEVSGCYAECTYIKGFLTCMRQVWYGDVRDNEIWNCGVDLAKASVQCYGINYYSGSRHIVTHGNRILNPYTAGVYSVASQNLDFIDNYICGQVDTEDGTLQTGAYAISHTKNLTIKGGTVENCAIAVEVQPVTYDSQIVIDGLTIRDGGILIRENSIWGISGGVTVTNCHLTGGNLQLRGSDKAKVGNVILANNIITQGSILATKTVFDSVIVGNTVYATNAIKGVSLGGAEGVTIMGNRIYGPGSSVAPSYGLYLNATLMNPSIIADNVLSGFSHGVYGPYAACNFHDNVFFDVEEPVADAVSGDLGRDAPSTIPNTVTTYWRRGQFIENVYPSAYPTILGWKCVGPAKGLGCTYSNATKTGDMISGETTITGVVAIGRYIPGAAITLANATPGPATLETEIVSWKVGYTLSSGSASFEDGEVVEGRTSTRLCHRGGR